jgi:hypothetical protein
MTPSLDLLSALFDCFREKFLHLLVFFFSSRSKQTDLNLGPLCLESDIIFIRLRWYRLERFQIRKCHRRIRNRDTFFIVRHTTILPHRRLHWAFVIPPTPIPSPTSERGARLCFERPGFNPVPFCHPQCTGSDRHSPWQGRGHEQGCGLGLGDLVGIGDFRRTRCWFWPSPPSPTFKRI